MPPSKPFSAGPPLLLALLLAAPPLAAADKDTGRDEDERLVKDARVATDADGLLAFFRQRTLSATDQRTIARLVRQLGSRSYAQREAASRRLVQWGPSVLEA